MWRWRVGCFVRGGAAAGAVSWRVQKRRLARLTNSLRTLENAESLDVATLVAISDYVQYFLKSTYRQLSVQSSSYHTFARRRKTFVTVESPGLSLASILKEHLFLG